uniref:Uncharacterized protein n=1 Tax=viral metagenome TaxID=1070528 RepID=A0A6C0HIP1_9ZZZZ
MSTKLKEATATTPIKREPPPEERKKKVKSMISCSSTEITEIRRQLILDLASESLN